MAAEPCLIREAQQGDGDAFERLVRPYEERLFNLSYRLMGNRFDAADAAQEAIIKLYVQLPRFRGESSFATWLFRVVTNTCLDELRRRARRQLRTVVGDQAVYEGLSVQHSPAEEHPDLVVERNELRREIHRAIQELGEDHRVAVVLRDIQGYSYFEIASALGCSVGAVKSRVHRGRLQLRARLSRMDRPN